MSEANVASAVLPVSESITLIEKIEQQLKALEQKLSPVLGQQAAETIPTPPYQSTLLQGLASIRDKLECLIERVNV